MVEKFSANPTTVTPFGTTTLSWQVMVPSDLDLPVSMIVDGQKSAPGVSSGSSSFSLRSGGTVAMPVLGGATIAIPLHLDIPDWFDADMDITIQLAFRATVGSVTVQVNSTDVHVKWTWLQDLAGCTDFGEQLSQAFMSDIVQNELAPMLESQINSGITSFATSAQQSDPQHRSFVLTYFSYGPDGMTFTVCPEGAAASAGGGAGLTTITGGERQSGSIR